MKDEIRNKFGYNLARVEGLLRVHDLLIASSQSSSSGALDAHAGDVLRAALVLLHASLEDVVRTLLDWRLPYAAAEELAEIPLSGTGGRKTRFSLGELSDHRGLTVHDLIGASVTEYLERHNLNHFADLKRDLLRAGVECPGIEARAADLTEMMTRRHWIVHRADHDHKAVSGQYMARRISKAYVEAHVADVTFIVDRILAAI